MRESGVDVGQALTIAGSAAVESTKLDLLENCLMSVDVRTSTWCFAESPVLRLPNSEFECAITL